MKLLGIVPLALLIAGALILESPEQGIAPEGACAQEFSQGFTGTPFGLAVGPDRRFWFTEQLQDLVGVFDPATGRAQEFLVPEGTQPNFIAAGPDGKLWFSGISNVIGSVDPDEREPEIVLREGRDVPPGSIPQEILAAPDGNLYITLQEAGFLARLDPRSEEFELIPVEGEGILPVSRPNGMALDPGDRHIWVALQNGDAVARFDFRAGRFDRTVRFSSNSGPHKLAFGPDGKLYVTLQYASAIGEYDPETGDVEEIPSGIPEPRTPDFAPGPKLIDVIADPSEDAVWISTSAISRLFRLDLETRRITRLDCGITPGSGTLTLVEGPDRSLWFSEPLGDDGRIARLDQ